MIGLDARTTETFQVLFGVNARPNRPDKEVSEMGVVQGWHLTPKGLDRSSGRWKCDTEANALESLASISNLITAILEPWFQAHMTLSSVAREMDTNQFGLQKAHLFLLERQVADAKQALLQYRNRLATPKPWDDPKRLKADQDQVDALLRDIGAIG